MLKVPIRLTSITLRNMSSGCGPSLPIVFTRDRDAGAVDEDARLDRTACATSATAASGIFGARHVAFDRDAAELGCDLFGTRQPDIEDRDLGAPGSKRAGRGLAQSRAAAGDDRNLA